MGATMPSNKQLIDEANAIAEELGEEISTKDLKNDELAELVSDLKAKAKDAESTAAEEAIQAAKDEGPVEEKPPYVVAKGKAITSLRGVIGPGGAIYEADLSGGEKSFKAFLNAGHIIKNS